MRDLLRVLFPGTCPCGARGEPCCDRCLSTLTPAPCMPPPAGLDWWVAPYAYEGVVRELIARAKYRGARAALEWLAAEVARACASQPAVDVVTWAPASSQRLRSSGIDHASVLARHVAARLELPVRALLVRASGTPQTGATGRERRIGPRLRARQSVQGMNVLIVDDVATTGATLAAAARALRVRGAASVAGATAARTPAPARV